MPVVRATAIMIGSFVVAYIVELLVHRVLVRLTEMTKTNLDDRIVAQLRRPIFFTAIIAGAYMATSELRPQLSAGPLLAANGVVATFAIILWSGALIRVGSIILLALSAHATERSLIQSSSLPLFDIALKLMVVVGAVYFGFLAWRIDVTAWLASAGIIGIAVGFGAKDTLANLFAGIFIIVDAPYRVGDFIMLDGGVRGRVTSIGMRSTRMLTLDQVEVTIPNGLIGSGRITNEAGGPNLKQRLHVKVSAAYGSNIAHVKAVLLECVKGVEHVCNKPAPEAHFVAMGDSALQFHLLAWVEQPRRRDQVLDALNTRVYNAFANEGIEIPYNKYDVYIKSAPPQSMAVPP